MNKRGVGLDSEPITVNTDQNSKSFYINHLDQVEVYGEAQWFICSGLFLPVNQSSSHLRGYGV